MIKNLPFAIFYIVCNCLINSSAKHGSCNVHLVHLKDSSNLWQGYQVSEVIRKGFKQTPEKGDLYFGFQLLDNSTGEIITFQYDYFTC